ALPRGRRHGRRHPRTVHQSLQPARPGLRSGRPRHEPSDARAPADERHAYGRLRALPRAPGQPADGRRDLMSRTIRSDQTTIRVRAYRDEPPFEPTPDERGLRALIGDLSREIATLARQEVALAKAELSEKAAVAARNAMYIAIGGLVAYAGFLVLLGAI